MAKNDQKKGDQIPRVVDLLGFVKSHKIKEYDLVTKKIGIEFLDAHVRIYKGDEIPAYSEVAELLSIPESTLRLWWKKRDDIICQAETALAKIPQDISLMMTVEIYNIVTVLKERGYENISTRDLQSILNTYVSSSRLLNNKSTANVAIGSTGPPLPVL